MPAHLLAVVTLVVQAAAVVLITSVLVTLARLLRLLRAEKVGARRG